MIMAMLMLVMDMVGQTHDIVLWISMCLSIGHPVPSKRTEKAELMGLRPRQHLGVLSVWCWGAALVVVVDQPGTRGCRIMFPIRDSISAVHRIPGDRGADGELRSAEREAERYRLHDR
jgi:hypothetical protein